MANILERDPHRHAARASRALVELADERALPARLPEPTVADTAALLGRYKACAGADAASRLLADAPSLPYPSCGFVEWRLARRPALELVVREPLDLAGNGALIALHALHVIDASLTMAWLGARTLQIAMPPRAAPFEPRPGELAVLRALLDRFIGALAHDLGVDRLVMGDLAPAPTSNPPTARPPRVIWWLALPSAICGVAALVSGGSPPTRVQVAAPVETPPPPPAIPAAPIPVRPSLDGFTWQDVGGSPMLATIANSAAVCGRVQSPAGGASLACVDAATLALIWLTPPLEMSAQVAPVRAGQRLAYADKESRVHLLAVDSGAEVAVTPVLSDRIEALCPDRDRAIFAALVDEQHVSIDLHGSTHPHPQPPVGCSRPFDPDFAVGDSDLTAVPHVAGFEPHRILRDGRHVGAAAGIKSPGTPHPMAIGFDPDRQTVRWVVRFGDPVTVTDGAGPSALAAGRYVGAYQAGNEPWHLVALDAKTGHQLWESTLHAPYTFDALTGIVADADRIYVEHMDILDVLDARTGARVGRIGGR